MTELENLVCIGKLKKEPGAQSEIRSDLSYKAAGVLSLAALRRTVYVTAR
jgi:hypothetical protein